MKIPGKMYRVAVARVLLAALFLSVTACPSNEQASDSSLTPASEPAAVEPTVEVEDAAVDYELEEWGLIRIRPDLVEVATSSGREAIRSLKPVVYLFPGAGAEEGQVHDVSIEITYTEAARHEIWPPPTRSDEDRFSWDVRVTGEYCDGANAPRSGSWHCDQFEAPMYCETSDLPRYLQAPRPCLQVGRETSAVLLYNGFAPEPFVQPVRFEQDQVFAGPHPIAHLYALREDGIYYTDTVVPGEPVEFPDEPQIPLRGGAFFLSRHLDQVLAEVGLRTRADFLSAWVFDVLGDPLPWRVLGVYAPEATDLLFPMEATPPPSRSTRVLAFVVEDPSMPESMWTIAPPSGAPTTHPTTVVMEGAMDGELATRVVRERRRELNGCYTDALRADPFIAGELVVQIPVDDRGEVGAPQIRSSTIQSTQIERCVLQRVPRWRFPAQDADSLVEVTIRMSRSE